MDFQNVRTEVTTEVKKIQNGFNDFGSNMADNADDVITSFTSLGDIKSDSDNEDHVVTVTKTVTYSSNSGDLSEEHNMDPEVIHVDGQNNENHVLNGDEHEVSTSDVEDFFSPDPTTNDSAITTTREVNLETDVTNSMADHFNAAVSDVQNDVDAELESINDDIGKKAEEEEDRTFEIADSLLRNRIADVDDVARDKEGDINNLSSNLEIDDEEFFDKAKENVDSVVSEVDEFKIPDVDLPSAGDIHIETVEVDQDVSDDESKHDQSVSPDEKPDADDGIVGTIKEKVTEVRSSGLNYAGDAITDKLNNASDDGIMGTIKQKAAETNAVETAKEKITEASDSAINNEALVDTVKDKIGSSGLLGSFGSGLIGGSNNEEKEETNDVESNEASTRDSASDVHAPNGDESAAIIPTSVVTTHSEPPTIEIDTANALNDDDMEFEMKEVDISINNEEDFGKMFAENRQSMREGSASPLFRRDASSRFQSSESLKSENKESAKKKSSNEVDANKNYPSSGMPSDNGPSSKTCAGILQKFFCPKQRSWNPSIN